MHRESAIIPPAEASSSRRGIVFPVLAIRKVAAGRFGSSCESDPDGTRFHR
jgi:hypothetical protein